MVPLTELLERVQLSLGYDLACVCLASLPVVHAAMLASFAASLSASLSRVLFAEQVPTGTQHVLRRYNSAEKARYGASAATAVTDTGTYGQSQNGPFEFYMGTVSCWCLLI